MEIYDDNDYFNFIEEVSHDLYTIINNIAPLIAQKLGKEIREQSIAQEGKIPDMIVGCLGGGSNFAGSIYEFLDEPNVKKIGVKFQVRVILVG